MQFRGPQKTLTFRRGGSGAFAADPTTGEERESVPFSVAYTVENDPPPALLLVKDIEPSNVSFWLDGKMTTRNGAVIPAPLRIEWRLYVGTGCMVDQDPFVGLTIIKPSELEPDGVKREGLLFQVDARIYRSAWLCGRLVDVGAQSLSLAVSLRVLFGDSFGRPELLVGTAIG
jgi:hypothetical protein